MLGGVVGEVVVPAVPDDVCPGSGEDAYGVGVVVSAGDGAVVEVGKYRRSSDKLSQIPDTTVYDQNGGKKLRFYSDLVKGKTGRPSTSFTTCTTICPPLTATFRKVQQELGERVGRDIQMISVSVDPDDRRAGAIEGVLSQVQGRAGIGNVCVNRRQAGGRLALCSRRWARTRETETISPMMLVGNDHAGYWTRTYGLAPVSTIVKVITDAADKTEAETTAQVPIPGTNTKAIVGEQQVQSV